MLGELTPPSGMEGLNSKVFSIYLPNTSPIEMMGKHSISQWALEPAKISNRIGLNFWQHSEKRISRKLNNNIDTDLLIGRAPRFLPRKKRRHKNSVHRNKYSKNMTMHNRHVLRGKNADDRKINLIDYFAEQQNVANVTFDAKKSLVS